MTLFKYKSNFQYWASKAYFIIIQKQSIRSALAIIGVFLLLRIINISIISLYFLLQGQNIQSYSQLLNNRQQKLIRLQSNKFTWMQPIKYSFNPSILLSPSQTFSSEQLFTYESPKFNHLRLHILGQQRTISPWFNSHLSGHHNLQKVLGDTSQQKHTRRRSVNNIPTTPLIMKPLEVEHQLYKMNRTLVQFRVKPSKSRANKRINSKNGENKLFFTLNTKQQKSKKKETLSNFSADKTPKIQFLQRKLKLKESFLSNNRRMSNANSSFTVTKAEWSQKQSSLSKRRNSLTSQKVSRIKWVQSNEKKVQFQSCYEL